MPRAWCGLVLIAIVWPGESVRAQNPFAEDSTLDRASLIEAVLQRNPSLEAARQAWRAAGEGVPQASSLEDPMVSYSFAPTSIGSSEVSYGQVLTLAQRLPYPGTLRQRRQEAEASAQVAHEWIEEIRLDLVRAASLLYDDYWLVSRALEITEEHRALLETFQRVATSRYATGEAGQQAPIQAEVEASHLLHRQVVLRSERRRLVARLNALLHRAAAASLPPPPLRLDEPAAGPPAVPTGASDPGRPELARQRAEIEALKARVALEVLRKKPDFEVVTSYNSMWAASDHRLMVGVGLRVPIWRQRLDSAVAEAEARLAAAEAELAALEDTVRAEIELALASLEEAEHVVRLYRNRVLPAARDQVAAARAGFETGQGSMLALIDAQRSLLTAELSHEEAVAGVSRARADLGRALGRLPSEASFESAPSELPESHHEDQP